MHTLAIKQPHEILLILLRYRTSGHNVSVVYCMGETAIVYITVVILLTARKPEVSDGQHSPSNKLVLLSVSALIITLCGGGLTLTNTTRDRDCGH